jgi:hypothetical protein
VTIRRRKLVIAALASVVGLGVLGARDAQAHLNSPDLFHEGLAGPYRVLVTIRPPEVIPGVATIEVLAPSPDLGRVTLVPMPMRGPGAISPPVADVAVRDPSDARRFQGKLWLMASGSWQVRVHAEGPLGAGELAVPVAALAMRTKTMQWGLGAVLLALLAFLVAGMVGIIGASVRDADLAEGIVPDARRRRKAGVAQAVTVLVLAAAVAGGFSWWGGEASVYGRLVYKPISLAATVTDGATGGRALDLTLTDPGWLPSRKLDDLLPDHGHLMHLFVVRLPGLSTLAHLHPTEVAPGHFTQALPSLPAGEYQLFADIVHANGLGETGVARVTMPDDSAKPAIAPAGDDAVGIGVAIADAAMEAANETTRVAVLVDGTRVTWLRGRDSTIAGRIAPLTAGQATWFRFSVEDRDGKPARDVLPYMGMAGHAVFLSHDLAVFAHVHPSGSVPMAALALVDKTAGADPHAGHHMAPEPLPPEIAFPYACPRAGDYRIFVQFRRGDAIETAIFDAKVR